MDISVTADMREQQLRIIILHDHFPTHYVYEFTGNSHGFETWQHNLAPKSEYFSSLYVYVVLKRDFFIVA